MNLKSLTILFLMAAAVLMAGAILLSPVLWSSVQILVIHFDALGNIDVLGGRLLIVKLLAMASIIFLVNVILATFLYLRRHFLAQLLAIANLMFMILVLVASLVIRLNNNF